MSLLDKIWDVIVVGAGPAGCMAACQLADAGKQVLLLEKAALPRYKTCGGGLTRKAQALIPFDISHVANLQAQGSQLTHRGRLVYHVKLEKPYATLVNRAEFDHFLALQAEKKGAVLHQQTRVINVMEMPHAVAVQTDHAMFHAAYVIAADGVNSIVARTLGLMQNRSTGYCIEAEIRVPGEAMQRQSAIPVFDFGATRNGYGWIFPKREHLSVGIANNQPRQSQQLGRDFARFLDMYPILAAREILSKKSCLIPLAGDAVVLHTRRCLLAGDAGNLVDPFLGEGIYYALLSGKKAAEVLLTSPDDLSIYSHWANDTLVKNFQQAGKLARLVYAHPQSASFMLKRSSLLQQYIFQLIAGETDFIRMTADLKANKRQVFQQVLIER